MSTPLQHEVRKKKVMRWHFSITNVKLTYMLYINGWEYEAFLLKLNKISPTFAHEKDFRLLRSLTFVVRLRMNLLRTINFRNVMLLPYKMGKLIWQSIVRLGEPYSCNVQLDCKHAKDTPKKGLEEAFSIFRSKYGMVNNIWHWSGMMYWKRCLWMDKKTPKRKFRCRIDESFTSFILSLFKVSNSSKVRTNKG